MQKICLLSPKRFPTPFGSVGLPNICLPPLGFPKLDDRRREALGHAIGSDLARVVSMLPFGVIPVAGPMLEIAADAAQDVIEDMHRAEVKRVLNDSEYACFLENTKIGPDSLALIRCFLEEV